MQRFFVVGCQRSGTTLLRLILEGHPRVHCFDELSAYRALTLGDPPPPGGATHVGFKIPRWTEQLLAPEQRDLGLDEVGRGVYLGEPIVFLHRDVHDVVASMLALPAGEASWLKAWGIPILASRAEDPAFRARYARELSVWGASPEPEAAAGALYWRYKSAASADYRRAGLPVHDLRYEDLVRDPRPTLERVVAFLGLPWDPALLRHAELSHGELVGGDVTVGDTRVTRPVDTASVDRGRSLTPAQRAAIAEVVAGFDPRGASP